MKQQHVTRGRRPVVETKAKKSHAAEAAKASVNEREEQEARPEPSHEEREVGRRILQLRRQKEWTQKELADKAGVTQQNVSDAEGGKLPLWKRMSKIADALGVGLDYLKTGNSLHAPTLAMSEADVPLIGVAGAGRLVDVTAMEEPTYVVRLENDQFPNLKQYALRLEGRSMEKEFPDGSIVYCVPYEKARAAPTGGDFVHVVVKKTEQVEEWTVKRLRIQPDGSIELWPESYDPRYQKPMVFNPRLSSGEQTVILRGYVIGAKKIV